MTALLATSRPGGERARVRARPRQAPAGGGRGAAAEDGRGAAAALPGLPLAAAGAARRRGERRHRGVRHRARPRHPLHHPRLPARPRTGLG